MLKGLREKAQLTQQQLADAINKDRSTIAKIEAGAKPSVDTAKAIANVLGINWAIFFEDQGDDSAPDMEKGAIHHVIRKPAKKTKTK